MAQFSINDEIIIKGKMTVRRVLDAEGNISIVGSLATHYYFEEIASIDSYRFTVKGVEVFEEIFASDDFDILYNFKAKSINVKKNYSNLGSDEITKIENNIYKEDGYLKESLLGYEVKTSNE